MAATSKVISDEALTSTWSDSDLTRLSRCIVDWESIAPVLSITEAEEREIKEDNPHDYQVQKYAMLRKWKAKAGDDATYGQLIRVFRSIKEMGLVEHVQEIVLHPEESAIASNVLTCYQEFLQRSYCKMPHPSLLPDQWPVMEKPVFVSLSLATSSSQLLLSDLFVETKTQKRSEHHRVLLRGLPGSGKTTLTWHVSQLWAKKELFQQFTLFLTVSLRSRQVQQATCLTDLIPHPDQEQRRAIAQALSTSHGDGVCFWFDGWDEMPESIQKQSFIASFIRQDAPVASLPSCTIAVTSRSETQYLEGVKNSTVDLESLNESQVEELVIKNTEGTGHDANELLTALESKAALSRFCSLPITVTILIHLFFTFGVNIPTTQTELFQCLILNLLLRNLQTRWLLPVKTLESFDSLPEFANKCFRFLCKLAYDGVMQKKAVFRPSDIPNLQLPLPLATLGLMRINPHIKWFGIDEELTFIHSTVQEFLAAYHLSLLPSDQQVSDLNKIMKSQHTPVIVFFGGLTKFSGTKGSFPTLQSYYSVYHVEAWFFSLVESLYEASNPSLFHCRIIADSDNKTDYDVAIKMCTNHLALTPAQMVPLGYFIVHLCSKRTCALDLFNCNYSKSAIMSFVKTVLSEWTKLDPKPAKPNLTLVISDSSATLATQSVSQLVANTDLLHSLDLTIHLAVLVLPWLTPTLSFVASPEQRLIGISAYCRPLKYVYTGFRKLNLHSVMRPLIAALSRNSSMVQLNMKFRFPYEHEMPTSALIAYSEYYMVLLLSCCHGITELQLKKFLQPRHPYELVSAALRHNKTIRWLDLQENVPLVKYLPCFKPLVTGIALNRCLRGVGLFKSVTDESLLCFLKIVLMNGSLLRAIAIDILPTSEVDHLLAVINRNRLQHSQHELIITYISDPVRSTVAFKYDGFNMYR